jgi:predicted SprT family Zn-dependent metalloprotease
MGENIEKIYPKKGNLQMVKYTKIISFSCGRCEKQIQSKSRAESINAKGEKVFLCNGCYGFLLSHPE